MRQRAYFNEQALDITAPTVLTWGYAPGALAALRAWLDGGGSAAGRPPVSFDLLPPTRA